jgi:sugar/nucleoside kinase (ribokinase family)
LTRDQGADTGQVPRAPAATSDNRDGTGSSPSIVVVGDLVTDVLVVTDGALAIGSDTDGTVRFAGGGQAANTAAWLTRASGSPAPQPDATRPGTRQPGTAQPGRLQPDAPWPVTLIAAIGDDDAGRARLAELTRLGVYCAVSVHPGAATGSVVVLTATGERTMVADRSANLLLCPTHVTAALGSAILGSAGHVHLSGYVLLDARTRPAGLAALAAARAAGATASVDAASAAPLAALGAAAFLELVQDVDLLLANADEAAVLTGAGLPDTPQAGPGPAERQAAALTSVARAVVVKRGAAGAVWCGRDGVIAVVGGERVPQIDPTGAGDAFAAGLLAAWCAGASPAAALTAGAALGAQAVRTIGARPTRSS